jgi:hypothetical protein
LLVVVVVDGLEIPEVEAVLAAIAVQCLERVQVAEHRQNQLLH